MSQPTHCQANQRRGGTDANVRSTFTPARRGFLQRKCACGGNAGSSGECEECRKKKLQRKARNSEGVAQHPEFNTQPFEMPSVVHAGLLSAGQPLDSVTRTFMEPRFGHNFSQVRVHADRDADNAAQAVQARAYTYGRDIVFAHGEYAPGTARGKELLAHELTHVVQQSSNHSAGAPNQIAPANDPAETEADRMAVNVISSGSSIAPSPISHQSPGVVSRQGSAKGGATAKAAPPSQVDCPKGKHGAPDNAEDLLNSLEITAMLATVVAHAELSLLQIEATSLGGGFTMPSAQRIKNYSGRFGLPPAAGKGKFKNRLSGATFPSQAQALVEEAKSLQDRYSKIADFLGGSTIRFRCITDKATDGSCDADCSSTPVAFGCPRFIFLCPKFWALGFDVKSQLLIHEAAHALFGIFHGHNFTHADCYAAYAADAGNVNSPTTPVCVP